MKDYKVLSNFQSGSRTVRAHYKKGDIYNGDPSDRLTIELLREKRIVDLALVLEREANELKIKSEEAAKKAKIASDKVSKKIKEVNLKPEVK